MTHSQLLVLGLRRVLHGPLLPATTESSCRDQGPSSAQCRPQDGGRATDLELSCCTSIRPSSRSAPTSLSFHGRGGRRRSPERQRQQQPTCSKSLLPDFFFLLPPPPPHLFPPSHPPTAVSSECASRATASLRVFSVRVHVDRVVPRETFPRDPGGDAHRW